MEALIDLSWNLLSPSLFGFRPFGSQPFLTYIQPKHISLYSTSTQLPNTTSNYRNHVTILRSSVRSIPQLTVLVCLPTCPSIERLETLHVISQRSTFKLKYLGHHNTTLGLTCPAKGALMWSSRIRGMRCLALSVGLDHHFL